MDNRFEDGSSSVENSMAFSLKRIADGLTALTNMLAAMAGPGLKDLMEAAEKGWKDAEPRSNAPNVKVVEVDSPEELDALLRGIFGAMVPPRKDPDHGKH